MVGKNNVGAIADKEIAINSYTSSAQRIDFLHEGEWVKYDPVADHSAAAFA